MHRCAAGMAFIQRLARGQQQNNSVLEALLQVRLIQWTLVPGCVNHNVFDHNSYVQKTWQIDKKCMIHKKSKTRMNLIHLQPYTSLLWALNATNHVWNQLPYRETLAIHVLHLSTRSLYLHSLGTPNSSSLLFRSTSPELSSPSSTETPRFKFRQAMRTAASSGFACPSSQWISPLASRLGQLAGSLSLQTVPYLTLFYILWVMCQRLFVSQLAPALSRSLGSHWAS